MVYYGLNKVKPAFDMQYDIAILTLHRYLVALTLASKATCLALASRSTKYGLGLTSNITGLGLKNVGLKPIPASWMH